MKSLILALALVGVALGAHAQNAIPDLRGTWTGTGKSIVYGHNPHHPGSQTVASPPRVRDFEFTFVIDGQEERLVRGHNLSKAATTNESFAWSITADGRSIVGADTNGCYTMSIRSADLIENCHAHNGLNPTGSIVAACFMMSRQKQQASDRLSARRRDAGSPTAKRPRSRGLQTSHRMGPVPGLA